RTLVAVRSVKGNGTRMMEPNSYIPLFQIGNGVEIGFLRQELETGGRGVEGGDRNVALDGGKGHQQRIRPAILAQGDHAVLVLHEIDECAKLLAAFGD